ncbi:MAG: hypothetical protein KKD28_05190 [Chloroflexi bacterium]|nr:hypothetical protein [Chloroflexota bacterium]MBU1660850.1 hypothetical protein [Chloroflexota bacterium]
MTHHLAFIPPHWRGRIFWPLLALTVLIMLVFGVTGAPMNTEAAPYGVISFEVAGSVARAGQILASWDAVARERAAFGLGLDFLFIPVYALTISLGCVMAADVLRRHAWPLASPGAVLIWGVFLAALLDVIENIALTITLFGSVLSPWPQIAQWCAVPKFALLFLGLVYALFGAVVRLFYLRT